MEIIVGKNGNQKIPITEASVSRRHCKLTEQSDGTFLLEDLGSTNGTFVNGVKIIRTTVNRNASITLGSLTVSVEALVGPKPQEFTKDFLRLKSVYDQYHQELIKLEKADRMKNFYRSLPPTISAIVFALTLFLNGESAMIARSITGVVTILFVVWSTFTAYKSNKKLPEQRQQLFKQFQIDYVCPNPKCKHYLGDIPFENLQNRGTCDYCKCKWVE